MEKEERERERKRTPKKRKFPVARATRAQTRRLRSTSFRVNPIDRRDIPLHELLALVTVCAGAVYKSTKGGRVCSNDAILNVIPAGGKSYARESLVIKSSPIRAGIFRVAVRA